jgi:serine/threonine protein kinase
LYNSIQFDYANQRILTGRTPGEEKVDEGPFTLGTGGGGIGVVKIADFGLSKVIWRDGTKTPCGTVGYTAPEIVTSQAYTASVDVWALGCVLYTMLCGFPPFYVRYLHSILASDMQNKIQYKWTDSLQLLC